jgi:hypothetical protein
MKEIIMSVQPVVDHGQELAVPKDQAIGFVDTKDQFQAVTQALKEAGYADAQIVALQGADGIEMVKRLQATFYFGDGEDALIQTSLRELEAGHYAMTIAAKDRDDALRAVSVSEAHGAHSFSYFGTWVNERLTR